MIPINNFEITILKWESRKLANQGVNDFIEDCNIDGIEVIEITNHINIDSEDVHSYSFVFKTKIKDEVIP